MNGSRRTVVTLLALTLAAGAAPAAANEFGVAVIVGNRTYADDRVPEVAYAHNDADAFYRFVVGTLGFSPDNVVDLRDATKARMESAFGSRGNERGQLWRWVEADGGSDVVVFYSGHGVPGISDGRGYLLPVDANPDTAEINGYPIDVLYENLGKVPHRSVTVFLDACFSGASGDGGRLIAGASPVYVEADVSGLPGLTVLTAATGKQLASWDAGARHGLFTEHLLEALYGAADADGNGRVSAAETKLYLDRHMTRAARRAYGREQDAGLYGDESAVLSFSSTDGWGSRPTPGPPAAAFTVAVEPAHARVRILNIGPPYRAGMELEAGSYRVEASAEGYETATETVAHGATPTVHRLSLSRRGQPFTIAAEPAQARIRLLDHEEAYQPGMLLPPGSYRAEASAEGYETATEMVAHGAEPTVHRLSLSRRGQPFTIAAEPAQARIRLVDHAEAYRPGMPLPPGSYRVEASAEGYETATEMVVHGAEPTVRRIALRKAGPQAGEKFRDCPECPVMVVLPAGSYRMGSPSWEQGRYDNEGPIHEVTFAAPFALGVYEVTVAEFGRFVDETGYRTDAERDAKSGCATVEFLTRNKWKYTAWRSWRDLEYEIEGGQPVVCVSWNDAKEYAAWLSENTGMPYRLPSESEWEYAARSGSETKYHFGNDETQLCAYGNVADETPLPNGYTWTKKAACSDGAVYPTRAGTYRPNAFGLYDMHGNVWEWTEDCWNDSYAGALSDGSAWLTGNCTVRVLRGGSWNIDPSYLRAAYRFGNTMVDSGSRDLSVGFRVARTLAP